MNRLLSPNEAKFWLLDWVAPMNSVVVVRVARGEGVRIAREEGVRVARGEAVRIARGEGAREAGGKMRVAHGADLQTASGVLRDLRELPQRFAVPVVHLDAQQRPRWGAADRDGLLAQQEVSDDTAWLAVAERLQNERVGSAGHPPWQAVIQHHPDHVTLILAVNHALTDWRTSLLVAHAFLADRHPGPLAPPCEEMLPQSSFAAPDADALLDAWWSSRAGARWHSLGKQGLTAILPQAEPTGFALHLLSRADSDRLQARCEAEGVSLNGAVAIALRDTMQITAVAHSVDMDRFIRPPPPPGPGLAVAHVFTDLGDGPFWDAARDNRAALFDQIRQGAAGDILLSLPRLLMGGTPTYQPAVMTITGAPTVRAREAADPAVAMQLVMSSARGGGGIVILSHHDDCLQLIAGTPAGLPPVPLQSVCDTLLDACS
jgi:hypothetical protein